MKRMWAALLVVCLTALSTGCAAPNAVPAAAEATAAPESTPVQNPVPEESREVQQTKEIAFADESLSIAVTLPGTEWEQWTQEQLDALSTTGEKTAVNAEGAEKTKQVSKAVFGARKIGEKTSVVVAEETYTPADYSFADIQNYMQHRLQAHAGSGMYVMLFEELSTALLQGRLYHVFLAKAESKEMVQLYLMRRIQDGKAAVVTLTSDSVEGAEALLNLLDTEAYIGRVDSQAETEYIEYRRGEWKRGGQSKGRPLGPVYESEFADLQFQIMTEWLYADDAEIAESHGYEYTEGMDLEALLKEKDVFVETYAYDEWSPKTIMISYENAGALAASQSILFFAQNIERNKLDPDFSENEYESLGITTEELSGNEYVCVNLKNVTENRLEKFFLRKHGNWIIRVEIFAENASVMKTLQGWFSEPE